MLIYILNLYKVDVDALFSLLFRKILRGLFNLIVFFIPYTVYSVRLEKKKNTGSRLFVRYLRLFELRPTDDWPLVIIKNPAAVVLLLLLELVE
jgi:hypothetical protein